LFTLYPAQSPVDEVTPFRTTLTVDTGPVAPETVRYDELRAAGVVAEPVALPVIASAQLLLGVAVEHVKVVWACAPIAAHPQANPASSPVRIVSVTILFTFIAASPAAHTCGGTSTGQTAPASQNNRRNDIVETSRG
jgi:hypothetical protein